MPAAAGGPSPVPGRPQGSQVACACGQDDTTFHFTDTGAGLPSESVPYIVLPLGTFRKNTGLAIGDLAVVIYKDKITAAICGDLGPAKKIGEGSIRLHESLHPPAPDPCSLRQADGSCKRILNASITEDVLFFVFPGTEFGAELSMENFEAKVKAVT